KLLKKVLIYAQQSFGSFSAAGCRVEDSDLYAIQFQVSAPAEDINRDVKDGSLAENITTDIAAKSSWRHEHHSLANAVLHMYGFQVLLPQIFWVLSSEAHKGILAWREQLLVAWLEVRAQLGRA
uniref:Uncharacterized protein n=1 Tax=Oryzias latipes TaxID=8090 RepID=A0A3P9M4I3_ORYLA